MPIPKKLKADMENFRRMYDEYLDGYVKHEVVRDAERVLEANLGRAGVKKPRHKMDVLREEVKTKRIERRRSAMAS